jgi:hypothetical protein
MLRFGRTAIGHVAILAVIVAGFSFSNAKIEAISRQQQKLHSEYLATSANFEPTKDLSTQFVRHTETRAFVIKQKLDLVKDPVIVLGDSLTETSLLPETICGYPIVNGGIGGVSVEDIWPLASQFLKPHTRMLVLSVGTNNTWRRTTAAQFETEYRGLLTKLSSLSDAIVLTTIPDIENHPALAGAATPLNEVIKSIATDTTLPLVDVHAALSSFGKNVTIDGIHLSPVGSVVRTNALMAHIKTSLGCSAKSEASKRS